MLWLMIPLATALPSVQNEHIVAHYNFNQLSGNILDQKNNFDLENVTIATGYGIPSEENFSYQFNNSVERPFAVFGGLTFDQEITISVTYQVNLDNALSGWTCIVCTPRRNSTAFFNNDFAIMHNPKFNNTLAQFENDQNTSVFLYTDLNAPLGQSNRSKYYTVTATFNGTHGAIYRGSGLRDTGLLTSPFLNSRSPLYVGARNDTGGFPGRVDSLTIWNITLSQSDITQLTVGNQPDQEFKQVLESGTCSTETGEVLLKGILVALALVLVISGIGMSVGFLTIFGGVAMISLSFLFWGCLPFIGMLIALFGGMSIIYAIASNLGVKDNVAFLR